VNRLFENEKFRNDFEKVKIEWEEKAKENFLKPEGIKTESRKPSPSSVK
jgi:hypothetical protein